MITSVISCQQRSEAREQTIPQLEAAGLTPKVFLSPCDEEQPAGGRGNAMVSARAIRYALEANQDLLFCEDDIDLAPDFRRFLDLARTVGRVTYLYLHDVAHYMGKRYGLSITHAIQRRDPIEAGLYELLENRNLSGAQCVYLPLSFLKAAPVHVFEAGSRPIDIWLSSVLHEERIKPLVALPHPVQHRQVRVARRNPLSRNPDKYSKSFDLERRWVS